MRTEGNSSNNVVPLRTILQNFLNLVESYEAKRTIGVDAYEKEFQELKLFSESLKNNPDYQCKEGEKSVSRKKNRYKDILPFDYTRVTLTPEDDISGSDYINANFIRGASGSSAYIACQGPLAHTVNDFWKMVVECEVQVIVMACMEQESGKHKCENYWVEEEGVEKQFGSVTVWLKKCRNVCPDFLVRTMRIRYKNLKCETEERNVCQFHYSAWPDHGIVRVRPLLDMVKLIRDCQTSETLPVLIHCSAGCGRTGTICAIDYVWGLLRLGKLTPEFSLFELVRDMRRQRIAMVQTKDQYILVHRAVKELFQEQLKIIDAHIYANLDQNGLPFELRKDLEEPTYETIEFTKSQNGGTSPRDRALGDIGKTSEDKCGVNVDSNVKVELNNELRQKDNFNRCSSTNSLRVKKTPNVLNSLTSSAEFSEGDKSDIFNIDKDSYEDPLTAPESAAGSSKSVGLLRKPSIVKLKALFERSAKDKKENKPAKQLCRAKSDVSSSRFYSFGSSFGNSKRVKSPEVGEPISVLAPGLNASPRNDMTGREKEKSRINGKPPISAKPASLIKRSKSLKIKSNSPHPELDFSSTKPELNQDRTLLKSSSPSGGFNTQIAGSPAKVCVKKVEEPKLVIPPVHTEINSNFTQRSVDDVRDSTRQHLWKLPDRKTPLKNTTNPSKIFPNYVNIGYGDNSVKLGVARDMDDINIGIGTHSTESRSKAGKKKYDTVNPRSLGLLHSSSNGAGLTRSQSHVWQHEKLQLASRIFSDENLCKSKEEASLCNGDVIMKCGEKENFITDNQSIGKLQDARNTQVKSDISHSLGANNETTSPLTKPIARHRAPKTNPYTNFPLTGKDKMSPMAKRLEEVSITRRNGSESPKFHVYTSPQKRNTSIGESSESSNSNIGTPKNSLSATPTQSTEGLYSQTIGPTSTSGIPKAASLVKDAENEARALPKSILKGSLSSSSESDDQSKLIINKPKTSSPLFSQPNSFISSSCNGSPFSTPKINSVRTPFGIRERRNSFRQAVWKEAQNDGQQYHHPSSNSPPSQQYQTFPTPFTTSYSGSTAPSSSALNPSQEPVCRRDYEPIWPDRKANQVHISSTYVGDGNGTDANLSKTSTGNHPTFSAFGKYDKGHRNCEPWLQTSSESEEGTRYGESTFQSKLEEIKAMLEGLSTPLAATSTPPTTSFSNHGISNGKGNGLTHHRSLKSPSRNQYLQQQQHSQDGGGLSCFGSKRTGSFESISDDYEAPNQDNQLLLSSKSPFTFFTDAQQRRNSSKPGVSGVSKLELADTDDFDGGFECINRGRNAIQNGSYDLHYDVTPIPPPRTRAKKNMPLNPNDTADSNRMIGSDHRSNLSAWSNSDSEPRNLQVNSNKTSVYINHEDIGQQHDNMNGNIVGSSPKTLSRALGVFQAKAASVRSKFANWTESKERGQGTKLQLNGSNNHTNSVEENGFSFPSNQSSPSAASATIISSGSKPSMPRTSKHQYL